MIRSVKSSPRLVLVIYFADIFPFQSYHMAEALEERVTQELANWKELDLVDAEKAEVAGLRSAQKDIDELKAKVESLDKALTGSKATEVLALARLQKASETADSLRKEVEAEKSSSTALLAQVGLLTKRLDEAKVVGLSVAELYISAWLALVA